MSENLSVYLLFDGVCIREDTITSVGERDGGVVVDMRPYPQCTAQGTVIAEIRNTLGVILDKPAFATHKKLVANISERADDVLNAHTAYITGLITKHVTGKTETKRTTKRVATSTDKSTTLYKTRIDTSERGTGTGPADRAEEGGTMHAAEVYLERTTRAMMFAGRLHTFYGPLKLGEACALLATGVRMVQAGCKEKWDRDFAIHLMLLLDAAVCGIAELMFSADAKSTSRFLHDDKVLAVHIVRMHMVKRLCYVRWKLFLAIRHSFVAAKKKLPPMMRDRAAERFNAAVTKLNTLAVFLYARAQELETPPWPMAMADADTAPNGDATCPFMSVFWRIMRLLGGDGAAFLPYPILDASMKAYLYERRVSDSCDVCGVPTSHRCAGCANALFCSDECREAGWKTHKPLCRRFNVVATPPGVPLTSGGNCRVCGILTSSRSLDNHDLIYCGYTCYAAEGDYRRMRRRRKRAKAAARARAAVCIDDEGGPSA